MKTRLLLLLMSMVILNQSAFAESAKIKRLVQSFDCTQEYPADTYFGHGNIQVVELPAGRYREAEGKPLSRFGYRFQVENIGRPHLAVVRYPDDKRRYMCMMDGTSYDLTVGVFNGVNQPLSGQMLELKRIFWPRWNDCSIVFMTWSDGEPAAVADIKIYELEDLPLMDIPASPAASPRRDFGIQFEDPCGKGGSVGAYTHEEWVERMISYMKHTGQRLLTYPIIWYHHPLYPSDIEPCGDFGWVSAPDRQYYNPWTTQPADWVAQTLQRFSEEGLEFQASMTLLRLGSLMQNMNIDLDSIKAGADTYNNMLSNDQVQSSTMDWTPIYNVLNLQKSAEGRLEGNAYGERAGPFGKGVMFNPLHPTVQKAILAVTSEIANRYSKYPAFKGIAVNMWHATITWFFSLNAGYDDYTAALFQQETGIEIPVDNKAPDRFSKRYEFLVNNHLEKWIEWRCLKIRDLFRQMRDIVVAARPDLRLTISMWTETTIPGWVGIANSPAHQLYARKTTYDLYREGGFDVNLYQNEPGIEVDLSFVQARDRDGWGTAGVNTPLESSCMFRDHDFLDSKTLDAVAALPTSGAYVFDCWVEAWGDHKWYPCAPDDPQAKQFAVLCGKPAEGIFHMNSTYPKDGFWWDYQLRITSPFQAGPHYMEHAAHALAQLDACQITRGGLYLDSAHTDEIQSFARAYQTLPAQKFQTVGLTTDPVAVRTLVADGKRYLYLVNREYYPVEVELQHTGVTDPVINLATHETLEVPASWRILVGPYSLQSFALSPDAKITGFTATPPRDIAEALQKQAAETLDRIRQMQAADIPLPAGTDPLAAAIKTAMEKNQHAWLRRALNSYIIRKADLIWQSSPIPKDKQN